MYIDKLIELFEAASNAEQAEAMSSYMKNRFPFLGIKRPLRNELQKKFFQTAGKPETKQLKFIALQLWSLPQREYQYFCLDLLVKFRKMLEEDFIEVLEKMIGEKSWWDTVDLIAAKLIAEHFRRFPNLRDEYVKKWRKSDDFWFRRTCLLFQLHYKEDTDIDLIFELIKENLGSKEFFLNKAMGWCLREYSKTDAEKVVDFVNNTELSNLSRREALNWLKNQNHEAVLNL